MNGRGKQSGLRTGPHQTVSSVGLPTFVSHYAVRTISHSSGNVKAIRKRVAGQGPRKGRSGHIYFHPLRSRLGVYIEVFLALAKMEVSGKGVGYEMRAEFETRQADSDKSTLPTK